MATPFGDDKEYSGDISAVIDLERNPYLSAIT
jgi:hypothetical protein